MTLERLSSVKRVAKFLGTSEDDVTELLEDGRLGGVLVTALSRKGVSVTPNLKSCVEMVIRAIGPKQDESAFDAAAESTVTIMFTDIVGSTELTERLGDRRARDVLRRHDEVIRRHTKAHGGTEVKSMGDGFLLTFPSARRGVACAAGAQRELGESGQENSEIPMAVRMGLSVGEPIREDQDVFGKSVVLAERISAKAMGGEVLISQIVHALVAGNGEFGFREKGSFKLKGISGVHPLYEVLWRRP